MILLAAMAVKVPTIEVLAERWAKGVSARAARLLCPGDAPTKVAWALATWTGNVRTLYRFGHRQLGLILPAWVRHALGLEPGSRVVLELAGPDALLIRRATLADIPDFARAAVEGADRMLASAKPGRELKHFEKRCEQCGVLFCARCTWQRFCPVCRLRRDRAGYRAYWHRKGKLTPSYQRRLKRPMPAGAVPASTEPEPPAV